MGFDTRLTSLSANTTYYYRAVAESDEGDDSGSVRSFRTGAPIYNVITRIVETVRPVEEEVEEEVLIITLNANAQDVDRGRNVEYTVSYDNRTGLTLTDAILTAELPNELNFEDADPNPDDENRGELTFDIGTIKPGEKDSFLIEASLDDSVDEGDEIRFVARVAYNDNSRVRKVVEVVDESTFGELLRGGGTFTALLIDSLKSFFTSPILWLVLLALLIYFAIRYFVAVKDRKTATLV
ncbi:MAG: hypothetical protein A2Y84_01610 [Candidatus Colwellbacteria bacterium RBG_13_48_8]|uniref:DUF11 domain-containing protein n=1 Tax=Candidatus Colwellbacteria bacterium RBG_13_48_8 TaxID=1797685 RepID=A0A1G1YW52_9BACT|nr:MAG: hypothetical protein A2Y84_01610 [Candidatus Colwellbacteria bacterium RBG_13_48_8]